MPPKGYKLSEESLKRIREAAAKRRGKCFNPPMSEYQKQRIREANGKPKTEEHKKKIAETLKGRKNPEHSERMKKRIAEVGFHLTPFKKGHVSWNKGKKTRKSTKRGSLIQREWSLKIKDRDGNKCTKCGTQNGLHAHHIIPWKEKEELRFDVNNGITLCRSCHAKLEGFQVGHAHKKTNKCTITP